MVSQDRADVTGYTEARLFNEVIHYSYFVCAAQVYDYDLMEYLLGWGANVNDVSYKTGSYSEKKNALIGAIRAKLYGQYRYDFPPSKSEAQTLTHLEKMFDFPRTRRILYKKLLDAGADPNFKDDKGKTVLDYVLEERSHAADVEAAKLIQSYMN